MLDKIAIIECIFGEYYQATYPKLNNFDCYFFTNNSKIKGTLEASGWQYLFINFPLINDESVSSMQSKYIKYLQFLKRDEYSFFYNYDLLIYCDHKLELKDKHVTFLISKINKYSILIRDHPENRNNIWEEFGEAMRQDRYFKFMSPTIGYLREKIKLGYSDTPTVVTTGLITYKHRDNKVIDFTDLVYSDLLRIGTSECQIIWSMLGQEFTELIKIIKYNDLDLNWEIPQAEIDTKTKLFKLFKKIIKFFVPYGILKLWRVSFVWFRKYHNSE